MHGGVPLLGDGDGDGGSRVENPCNPHRQLSTSTNSGSVNYLLVIVGSAFATLMCVYVCMYMLVFNVA